MDRHRFRDRSRELRAFAERMTPLAKMPDRVTGTDLQLAADLATKAADHLDELLEARLPGCICRQIDNDNYSYLDYTESCRHHSQLYTIRESLKADYKKAEKTLKNEVRMKLVASALTGAAMLPRTADVDHYTEKAIEIADEVIRRITEIV